MHSKTLQKQDQAYIKTGRKKGILNTRTEIKELEYKMTLHDQ